MFSPKQNEVLKQILKDILNKNSVSNASHTKENENISVIDSKEKKILLKHINEEEMDDVINESLNKAFQKPKPVLKESMDKGSFSKSNENLMYGQTRHSHKHHTSKKLEMKNEKSNIHAEVRQEGTQHVKNYLSKENVKLDETTAKINVRNVPRNIIENLIDIKNNMNDTSSEETIHKTVLMVPQKHRDDESDEKTISKSNADKDSSEEKSEHRTYASNTYTKKGEKKVKQRFVTNKNVPGHEQTDKNNKNTVHIKNESNTKHKSRNKKDDDSQLGGKNISNRLRNEMKKHVSRSSEKQVGNDSVKRTLRKNNKPNKSILTVHESIGRLNASTNILESNERWNQNENILSQEHDSRTQEIDISEDDEMIVGSNQNKNILSKEHDSRINEFDTYVDDEIIRDSNQNENILSGEHDSRTHEIGMSRENGTLGSAPNDSNYEYDSDQSITSTFIKKIDPKIIKRKLRDDVHSQKRLWENYDPKEDKKENEDSSKHIHPGDDGADENDVKSFIIKSKPFKDPVLDSEENVKKIENGEKSHEGNMKSLIINIGKNDSFDRDDSENLRHDEDIKKSSDRYMRKGGRIHEYSKKEGNSESEEIDSIKVSGDIKSKTHNKIENDDSLFASEENTATIHVSPISHEHDNVISDDDFDGRDSANVPGGTDDIKSTESEEIKQTANKGSSASERDMKSVDATHDSHGHRKEHGKRKLDSKDSNEVSGEISGIKSASSQEIKLTNSDSVTLSEINKGMIDINSKEKNKAKGTHELNVEDSIEDPGKIVDIRESIDQKIKQTLEDKDDKELTGDTVYGHKHNTFDSAIESDGIDSAEVTAQIVDMKIGDSQEKIKHGKKHLKSSRQGSDSSVKGTKPSIINEHISMDTKGDTKHMLKTKKKKEALGTDIKEIEIVHEPHSTRDRNDENFIPQDSKHTDEKEDESRISNESDDIIHKKRIEMPEKRTGKIDAKNYISNDVRDEKNHVESSYRSNIGGKKIVKIKKSGQEVAEEKSTDIHYKDKHPRAIPIEAHPKFKQVVKKADIEEGSDEIIKTKEKVIGKTHSQIIGGYMTEKRDGKQLQTNSKNIKQTSLSKNIGKIQNQQDYSGKSVSSKSSSFKKSHSKSHHQSSTTHHKKSIVKHHKSASSSSLVKHGVKIPSYPFSDAVRGTKGSVR